ncbi:MAG: ribose 5-phosphate isomerase B [Planctomycetes bacterium]|nr:ribose 5-phosphate isomerase B [Planctomycetota bacterium]
MKIAVGADHAGFRIKDELKKRLAALGHSVEDAGTDSEQSVDYPDFAERVGRAIAEGRADRGVLVCGTGIGMSIAANKIAGVRAAVVTDPLTAEMSRRHNDANVFCAGARVLAPEKIAELLDLWLKTPFEGGRHERRVEKIRRLE